MPKESMPNKTKSPEEDKIKSPEELQAMDENEFEEWLFGNKKNSEKAEPEKSEEKKAEKETSKETAEAKTEKAADGKTPFEKHWKEGVEKLKGKYLGAEISKETQKEAENILEGEEESAKVEYVKQWAKDNKGDLEAKYPQTKEMDEEKLINFVLVDLGPEKNPLNLLENDEETQKKYADNLEKMQNLYVLREGVKKNPLDPEAQFLALNHFYEKAKNASKELSEKQKSPDSTPQEIEKAKKEWFRQSEIVKELTEKITGKDPKEQAEKEAEASAKKEKAAFLDSRLNRLEEIKSKRYNEILKNLSEDEAKYFKAGTLQTKVGDLSQEQVLTIVGTYGVEALRNIKHKNWFSDKISIGGQEVASDDLDNFLANKKMLLDEKIKQELQDTAELQWKRQTREKVGKRFDEIIKDVASPEKAKELIREKYRTVKEKMAEQWEKEAEAKKAELSKEKPKSGREKSKNADSALSVLELGSKKPEEISRYLRDHGDDFCNLLEGAGMNVDKNYLKKFAEKPKNRKAMSFFIKRFIEFMTNNAA